MHEYDNHATDHAILLELERLAARIQTLAEAIPEDTSNPETDMKLHDGADLDLFGGPARSYSFQLPDRMVQVIDELRRRGDPIVSRSEIVREMLAHGIGMVCDPDPQVEAFLRKRAGKVLISAPVSEPFKDSPTGSL